jgi:hypothetical protein
MLALPTRKRRRKPCKGLLLTHLRQQAAPQPRLASLVKTRLPLHAIQPQPPNLARRLRPMRARRPQRPLKRHKMWPRKPTRSKLVCRVKLVLRPALKLPESPLHKLMVMTHLQLMKQSQSNRSMKRFWATLQERNP